MTAFPVVVGLDVFKDIGPGCLPRRVADPVHLLHLQGMEEAFHGGNYTSRGQVFGF